MPAPERKYHLSISPDALQADPELLELAHRVGVSDVWLTGFLYGHWYDPLEKTRPWRQRAEKLGMAAHLINLPLGHPGDSLGATSGDVPLTPPRHWKPGVRPDGTTYAGTSLHRPATEENCAALRLIEADGVKRVFLDDDFRLARARALSAAVLARSISKSSCVAPAMAKPSGPSYFKPSAGAS